MVEAASASPAPPDVAATFCATLVDEWTRAGVLHALVAPGSRSTPMALALAADERMRVSVHHDERSAAFAAIGVALATGKPAVVLTTSGTAAVELHPAIVEAYQARVPMLVVTADRPPELRDVGAPQTIDQTHLFGRAVRWFADPGVADWSLRHTWRSLAARAVLEAAALPAGPVHLNLPFREPLVGTPAASPPGRAGRGRWHAPAARMRGPGVLVDPTVRGVVIAGHGAASHAAQVRKLAWPVLVDPRAGVPGIAHADPLLRVEPFVEANKPELILRLGQQHASRIVNEWADATGARQLSVGDAWTDPSHVATQFGETFTVLPREGSPRGWRSAWQRADALAGAAIEAELTALRSLTEPGAAREVVAQVPAGGHLVVASSMPLRDVEWYAPRRDDISVHANRGANGIDGVVSTGLGVALTGAATTALVGDLAFVHDSSALVALARRDVDLTIVVVDNDGGGIFSFLPQATTLPDDAFEQLFGTPHGTDCAALARAHGLDVSEPATPAHLAKALAQRGGVHVVVVRSDRARNVEVHRRLNAAVAEALTR